MPSEELWEAAQKSTCIVMGGEWMEPPPITRIDPIAQKKCISEQFGENQWPDDDCGFCIQPMPCTTPSAEEMLDANEARGWHIADNGDLVFKNGIRAVLLNSITGSERNILLAGIALLHENLDLVEWATCIATSLYPGLSQANQQRVMDCMLMGVGGSLFEIYLIDVLQYDNGAGYVSGQGNFATNWDDGLVSYYDDGIVLPVGDARFQGAAAAYASGSAEERLCAAMDMAGVILHEMAHLCGEDPVVIDNNPFDRFTPPKVIAADGQFIGDPADQVYNCWAISNNIQSMFQYAISRRYPCLQGLACCPGTNPRLFMSAPLQIPSAFIWNPAIPCP